MTYVEMKIEQIHYQHTDVSTRYQRKCGVKRFYRVLIHDPSLQRALKCRAGFVQNVGLAQSGKSRGCRASCDVCISNLNLKFIVKCDPVFIFCQGPQGAATSSFRMFRSFISFNSVPLLTMLLHLVLVMTTQTVVLCFISHLSC